MTPFFNLGLKVLRSSAVEEKFKALQSLKAMLAEGGSGWMLGSPSAAMLDEAEPAFPEGMVLFDPKDRHSRPATSKTFSPVVQTLHGLAHIELSAVHLWTDSALRFAHQAPGAAAFFAKDCIDLASDEALHFGWLTGRLASAQHGGLRYGDLPAHSGLWSDAVRSKDCILHRLTILALVQEARALDVHSRLVSRLKASNDPLSASVADEICKEEVRHVAIGMRYFEHFSKIALQINNEAKPERGREAGEGRAFSPVCGLEACTTLGRCCGLSTQEQTQTQAHEQGQGDQQVQTEQHQQQQPQHNQQERKQQEELYRRIVSAHYGSIPGPFNAEARAKAGMAQEWYQGLEKPSKKKKTKENNTLA